VYQRDIPYVLLVDAGSFDAAMLPRLLQPYRGKGFEFITLPEAERDEFYRGATELDLPPGPGTLEEAMSARGLPSPPRRDLAAQLDFSAVSACKSTGHVSSALHLVQGSRAPGPPRYTVGIGFNGNSGHCS